MTKSVYILITAGALLATSVNAGLGIGGCPKYYPEDGYASEIPDGTYYQNYYDRSFFQIWAAIYEPLLDRSLNGRGQDCTKTDITQDADGHGFSHRVYAPFQGSIVVDKTYNMNCYDQDYCLDSATRVSFDMIYLDSTNNVFMTYYCMDVATIIVGVVTGFMAGLTGSINQGLKFALEVVFSQINFFHLSYLEVWSPSRAVPAAALDDLKAFIKEIPTSSIGSDFTLLSLLAPIFAIFGTDKWSTLWLRSNDQSISRCYA